MKCHRKRLTTKRESPIARSKNAVGFSSALGIVDHLRRRSATADSSCGEFAGLSWALTSAGLQSALQLLSSAAVQLTPARLLPPLGTFTGLVS